MTVVNYNPSTSSGIGGLCFSSLSSRLLKTTRVLYQLLLSTILCHWDSLGGYRVVHGPVSRSRAIAPIIILRLLVPYRPSKCCLLSAITWCGNLTWAKSLWHQSRIMTVFDWLSMDRHHVHFGSTYSLSHMFKNDLQLFVHLNKNNISTEYVRLGNTCHDKALTWTCVLYHHT